MKHSKEATDAIKSLLRSNDRAVERAMVAIYKRQTVGERSTERTIESNGVGFNAFHAKMGTYYAMWVEKGRQLTGRHLEAARKMSYTYVGQLLDIAEEKRQVVQCKTRHDTIPCPPPFEYNR